MNDFFLDVTSDFDSYHFSQFGWDVGEGKTIRFVHRGSELGLPIDAQRGFVLALRVRDSAPSRGP
jgi:hypothetical protein